MRIKHDAKTTGERSCLIPTQQYGKITDHGRVAEWPIASVSKTDSPQGDEGSNPSSSI